MKIKILLVAIFLAFSSPPTFANHDFPAISTGEVANLIGTAGTSGFGVGVCPDLPDGFTKLSGYRTRSSANYGNYQYADGSIMVWVPKFYYKVGTGANGLAVNMIDVKGINTYRTTALANAAGYALHRAFIDGGSEKAGFFVDKYKSSKNAWGTGFIASSIQNGNPISTHADHNPIADLTAVATNAYWSTILAAQARDGVNGAVNASSRFFVTSRFIHSALAMLSMAHGQAATGTDYCAWYDAGGTTNFPKGANNNALGDTNDATIRSIWTDFPDRPCRIATVVDVSTRTAKDTRHPAAVHAYGGAIDWNYFTLGHSNRTQTPTQEVQIWTDGKINTLFDVERNFQALSRAVKLIPGMFWEVHSQIKARLEAYAGTRLLWLVASDGSNHGLHAHGAGL